MPLNLASRRFLLPTFIKNNNKHVHNLEKMLASLQVGLFPMRQGSKLFPVHAKHLGKLHVTEVLLLLARVHMTGHVLTDQDAVGQAAPAVGVAARDEAICDSLGLGDLRSSSCLSIDLLNIPPVLLPGTKVATKVGRLKALCKNKINISEDFSQTLQPA